MPVVADQQHGAVKVVQRHGQGFARGQIEVVGGLVQQQQVGALPDDHGQHQPGFFAAAHAAHALRDHVAAEVKAAQPVAQILLAAGRWGIGPQVARQAHHVLQRVLVGAQHVQLLLGKVANAQALALGQFACQRLQLARNGFDQR